MTTAVAPVAPRTIAVAPKHPRLPAGHAIFHKLYGHYPTECLIGCYREKGRGEEKVQVHRNSLGRPGDNAGLPFAETYAEKLARKAARRNGPVRVVAPPAAPTTPKAPKAAPTPKAPATPTDVGTRILAILTKLDERLTALESNIAYEAHIAESRNAS